MQIPPQLHDSPPFTLRGPASHKFPIIYGIFA